MTTIAQAHVVTTASPDQIFARWADMATWPEWNSDTEWVRLDGPFATGSTGTLKPKGGPKVPFVIASVVPGREFVDVSKLFGARLTFAHTVERTDAGCDVAVTISMSGPMAWFWTKVLGKGLRDSVQGDLTALAAAAVGVHVG